jgi:hypothetical protein
MRLCQFFVPGRGKRVGVVEGDAVVDVTSSRNGAGSALELIQAAGTAARLERDLRARVKAARTRMSMHELDRAPGSGREAAPSSSAAGPAGDLGRRHHVPA